MNENECKKPEDCNPRRRDKDVPISPVQFLRDREINTRGAKPEPLSMTITIMKKNIDLDG